MLALHRETVRPWCVQVPVGDAGRLHLVDDDDLLAAKDGSGQGHAQAGARGLGHLHQQGARRRGHRVCREIGEVRGLRRMEDGGV